MEDPIKITSLELENVKRIRAVQLQPSESGLTVIGGNNGEGKTSVLDAIAWALGGSKYKQPKREGSVTPPHLKVQLSNGIVVERKGASSTLKVSDPLGRMGGQKLLDSFVEELALNLPKFMEASSKEKAQTLLRVLGVEQKLATLQLQESDLYSQRHALGQILTQKEKHVKEMPEYDGVPADLVSLQDLAAQRQAILDNNHAIYLKECDLVRSEKESKRQEKLLDEARQRVRDLESQLIQARDAVITLEDELGLEEENEKSIRQELSTLQRQSTDDIDRQMEELEETNRKVRANLDREKAKADAEDLSQQYSQMTADIQAVRQEIQDLLKNAALPLPDLTVEDGELLYHGHAWDAMSSSEQLRVSCAIVRALKPQCGFVLMDKLEQMDPKTLQEFGAWLNQEGLQVIATRVSTGGECSIIIEDGYSKTPLDSRPSFLSGFNVGGEW